MLNLQTCSWSKVVRVLFVQLALLLTLSSNSRAAAIEGAYTALGGSRWSASFNVSHDTDPEPISQFTIFFSELLFASLTLEGTPTGWDSLVIQPDGGIPAAGFLDSLVLDTNDALGVGMGQSGFVVSFDYIGSGLPGGLPFDVLNGTFDVIGTGSTTVRFVSAIPEPGTGVLLLAAMAALLPLISQRGRRLTPAIGLKGLSPEVASWKP